MALYKAIFSGLTRLYVVELVENVVVSVELLIGHAAVGVAVVNEVLDMVAVAAQAGQEKNHAHNRYQKQDGPGGHVHDVIHICGIFEILRKIECGKPGDGDRDKEQ